MPDTSTTSFAWRAYEQERHVLRRAQQLVIGVPGISPEPRLRPAETWRAPNEPRVEAPDKTVDHIP